MKTFFFGLLVFVCSSVLWVHSSVAQAGEQVVEQEQAPEVDPYAGLAKSGTLSSTQSFGTNSKVVDGPFGTKSAYEDTAPPISGSMFRKSRTDWVAKVSNNTDDEFSVSLEAQQLDGRGKVLKRSPFSANLRPKETYEKIIPARADAMNGALKVKSWRVKRTKKEESASEGASRPSGSAPIR